MTARAGRRPVLGLLLNTFFDGYEEAIWRHVIQAAAEADVDLVCFLVGAFGHHEAAEDLFRLVDPSNVDGVIVAGGSVGWASGAGPLALRLQRLGALPLVSFSEDVGRSRVVADNAGGIQEAVEHLARVHGRRRIAFLAGPPHSGDAVARLRGYREGLARTGLPFDPALVLQGDFTRAGARVAFRRFDEAPFELDALVAGNDASALAAIDELRRRGRSVPADVAVCGFDDIADAACADPPLTTARQPLAEMAREAVRGVLAALQGQPAPVEGVFSAQLLVRQSCGCPRIVDDAAAVRRPPAPIDAGSLATALEREFPELGARLAASGWASELCAALLGALTSGDGRPWLQAIERLLARGLERVPEPGEWLRALRVLVAWAREAVPAPDRERLAVLHADANAVVAAMAAGVQLSRRVRAEEEARGFRWLVQPFPLVEDQFLQRLLAHLETLAVRSCFISRFLDAERTQAALVAHFDLDGVAELEESPAIFAPHRLVPGRFTERRRRAHAVLPVSSPGGLLGFVVCEVGPMSLPGYEVVMHQLSMVLSVNGLVAEVRDQQQQLLEGAHQAGMAEVAVGALHNVGNLLNSVGVAADEIREAASAAAASGLGKAAALLAEHAADLPGFFATDPRAAHLPDYLVRATEALGRELARIQVESDELTERTGLVRDSVRALQDHARGGRDPAARETIDLAALVRVALEIQRGHLERHRVRVRQALEELPPFPGQRSKLVHVLVNLVKNAVEAMRSTPEEQRVLTLVAGRLPDGRIRLEVRDAGEGIAPEHLERIFSYGFTTKRDGHGFGLHACAGYVEQMGGALTVASEGVGRGATFTLILDPGRDAG